MGQCKEPWCELDRHRLGLCPGSAQLDLPHNLSFLAEYDTENFNADLRYRTGGFGVDVAVLDGNMGYGAVFTTGF